MFWDFLTENEGKEMWDDRQQSTLARLKQWSASWTFLGHRMSLEVSCQHAIASSVTLYTWYKTSEKLSRWSWLALFEPLISLLLSHCIGPYLVQLFKESHIERQRKQEKGKHENKNRRGGDDIAIHEDFCMFDKKTPENSGNWLGLFWVYQWLWDEMREALRCSNRWM